MTRRIAPLALVAALALALTACTGLPPAGPSPASSSAPTSNDRPGDDGQSTADACAIVQESVDQVGDAFGSAAADDPATVVEAMRVAAQELADVSERVTNDEVAALLPGLQDLYDRASESVEALASGDPTRLGELNETAEQFQETSTRFAEICGAP
jgi:hypothetical protein